MSTAIVVNAVEVAKAHARAVIVRTERARQLKAAIRAAKNHQQAQ